MEAAVLNFLDTTDRVLVVNGGTVGQRWRLSLVAQRHGVFFIVDAIRSICADQFLMDRWHVDVAILSSQKALALPPGLSFIAMSEVAETLLRRGLPKRVDLHLKCNEADVSSVLDEREFASSSLCHRESGVRPRRTAESLDADTVAFRSQPDFLWSLPKPAARSSASPRSTSTDSHDH
jgi:hypothetical protein